MNPLLDNRRREPSGGVARPPSTPVSTRRRQDGLTRQIEESAVRRAKREGKKTVGGGRNSEE